MAITLTCNRGCKHEGRFCETSMAHDRCPKCESEGEPTCSIARFLEDNAADCSRRFMRHDCGHLTGFTRRAHAALVHLGDAANVADESNRPGIIAAIASVLSCRSIREEPRFARKMIDDDRVAHEAMQHDAFLEHVNGTARETLHLGFSGSIEHVDELDDEPEEPPEPSHPAMRTSYDDHED